MAPIEGHKLVCCLVGVTAYSMVVSASFVSTGPEGRVHGPRGDHSAHKVHRKDPGPMARAQREVSLCSPVEGVLVESPHGNDLVE